MWLSVYFFWGPCLPIIIQAPEGRNYAHRDRPSYLAPEGRHSGQPDRIERKNQPCRGGITGIPTKIEAVVGPNRSSITEGHSIQKHTDYPNQPHCSLIDARIPL